ncbi:capsular polysaccharide biosynthesis protein [Kitasatospora phosalacinea]|uniref:Capsular polysaccharide biosynthesis protein n=1 Tax=Kitasatospora phosalacinea TaxID=2065 RepID=A0A9W6V3H7_9ACTN|nr:CapA family protein [Kitasatospora phosalacinea]GLW71105.1 capsular polysaccharide biosynthesis protein [Kitasatospora phosalacinea]
MHRTTVGTAAAAATVLLLSTVAGCGGPEPSADRAATGTATAAPASATPDPTGAATAAPTGPAPGASEGSAPAGTGTGGSITVAFAGDVHFEGRTASRLGAAKADTALGPISGTLSAADLAVLNLETAITSRGKAEPKTYTFRTTPKALDALKDAGVDVVSQANNHAVDFGPDGLADTLAAKAASPIPVIGIGKDAEEAYAPYVTTVRGVKVAVLAASQVNEITNQKWRAGARKPGIASALDENALLHAVAAAKAQAPVVLVYLHWGDEGVACPTRAQTSLAKKLADAGATAVVGTHAHTMLGAGMLGKTYVSYGFGNFLWYGTSNYTASDETGVTTLTVTADGRVTGESFTPAHIDGRGVPVPQTGNAAKAAQQRRDGLRGCTGLAAVPK